MPANVMDRNTVCMHCAEIHLEETGESLQHMASGFTV